MNGSKTGYLMLLGIVLASIVQMSVYWSELPPVIASHFNVRGEPDGWMSKRGFMLVHAGVILAMVAAALGMRLLITSLPPWMINLPNRQYWLAPERKSQTARIIADHMVWLFVATTLFLLVIFELAYRANLGQPAGIRILPLPLLAVYLGFMTAWLVAFYRKFGKGDCRG